MTGHQEFMARYGHPDFQAIVGDFPGDLLHELTQTTGATYALAQRFAYDVWAILGCRGDVWHEWTRYLVHHDLDPQIVRVAVRPEALPLAYYPPDIPDRYGRGLWPRRGAPIDWEAWRRTPKTYDEPTSTTNPERTETP